MAAQKPQTSMQHNVLIVEDDRDLASNLLDFLEVHGYGLDYASDGQSALDLIAENHYDAILLDLSLPGMGGLAVCKQIRQSLKNSVPILVLTARDDIDTKIAAFDMGGDDYVVKPASLKEIEVRVRALIRRAQTSIATNEVLTVRELVFDVGAMRIERAGRPLSLAPVPTRILLLLMRASPNLVTYEAICREIWGETSAQESHALTVHMHTLRSAIDKPFGTSLIHTIRGFGYRIS